MVPRLHYVHCLIDCHLVCNDDVIFSVSEGRLRPGGDEEVVQADTVMYSNNIVATKEVEEMLNRFSAVLLFLVIWRSSKVAAESMLLAIWRTSGNCLPFAHPGVSSLRCGGRKGISNPYALRMQSWDRDEERNRSKLRSLGNTHFRSCTLHLGIARLNACLGGLGHLFREELSKFNWAFPCFLGGSKRLRGWFEASIYGYNGVFNEFSEKLPKCRVHHRLWVFLKDEFTVHQYKPHSKDK